MEDLMQNVTGNKTRIEALYDWLAHPPTSGPAAILLLRLMAGGVFLSEGILKFNFATLGVGRFAKLGFPWPHLTSTFVGSLEIVGGLLLIVGLFTRLFAIPFIVQMVVAILTTKISLYLGTSPLPPPPVAPVAGLAAVLHESRSDVAQLLTAVFLMLVGPGRWSIDALLSRRPERRRPLSASRERSPLTV
jgi:putative oxidoreductase